MVRHLTNYERYAETWKKILLMLDFRFMRERQSEKRKRCHTVYPPMDAVPTNALLGLGLSAPNTNFLALVLAFAYTPL